MNLKEILDKAKEQTGSDGNTARACGVTDSAISQWRSERTAPNNKQCAVLADLSGVPFGVVVACAEAQRAKNESERKDWRTTVKKLSAAAFAAKQQALKVKFSCIPKGYARAKIHARHEYTPNKGFKALAPWARSKAEKFRGFFG